MKIDRRSHIDADRYTLDFGHCLPSNGWAQVDSGQDASYYGNWTNPSRRMLVSFCEGDLTVRTAATDAEFVDALRETVAWLRDHTGTGAVDAMCSAPLIADFDRLGCSDLLH